MKITLIAISMLSISILTSCKKCAECHYDANSTEVELGEFCAEDLESIEKNGYYDSNTDSLYEVHCHEH